MYDADIVNRIMAYESGELDYDEIVVLFQDLIDSGLVWNLQGHYGRIARMLLDDGECTPPGMHETERGLHPMR